MLQGLSISGYNARWFLTMMTREVLVVVIDVRMRLVRRTALPLISRPWKIKP